MNKNNIRFGIFFFIVIVIIVGGFILMKKSESYGKDGRKEHKEVETRDIRIDKTKEHIYFEDGDVIAEDLGMEYKNIVFNFPGQEQLASKLNEETASLKETIKYDDTLENSLYNKLSSAQYKTYSVISVGNYLSLVVNYYHFNPNDLAVYEKTVTYVIDKNTGLIIEKSTLLNDFSLSEDDLKNKVKTYVDDQNVLRKDENLDSSATLSSLNNDYALYVDKLGKLVISVLVKSDQKDYNDVITLS